MFRLNYLVLISFVIVLLTLLFPSSHILENFKMVDNSIVKFIKETTNKLFGSLTDVSDTTATLTKQLLLQKLIASGLIEPNDIKKSLQIGIDYFLNLKFNSYSSLSVDNQYEIIEREKFPVNSSENTTKHTLPDFDIEAYALDAFYYLMNIYGNHSQKLQQSIKNGELEDLENPANSGSLLYTTSDKKFIIKTVRDYEFKFIQQIFLKEYSNYMKLHGNQTYLTKFESMFGYIPYVTSPTASLNVDSFTLRFIIFRNFIPINLKIHEKYDLKGSSYGRDANIDENQNPSTTLKDNEFREKHPNGLIISSHDYNHIKDTLTRDTEVLKSLNIMDYSLLLVIHNMNRNDEKQKDDDNKNNNRNDISDDGISALNENGERLLIYFGLIDLLQTFDVCKVIQHQWHSLQDGDDVDKRSINEPEFYAKRFQDFVFNSVFKSSSIDD